MEVSDAIPGVRSLMYRRIGVRQQEIYAKTAPINEEYYGCCATAAIEGGLVDLATIVDPVPVPEAISRVEIVDAGESEIYETGDEIHIVTQGDPWAAIAPRMTVRNRLMRQVGTDLADIVSLQIFYSYRPPTYCPTDACVVVGLRAPYDELLVIDLTKYVLMRAVMIDAQRRAAAIAKLDQEEADLLSDYERHVRNYVPGESRFNRPPLGLVGAADPGAEK
jgi:hypothetical protein